MIILDYLICIDCQLPDVFLSENVAKDHSLVIGQQIFFWAIFEGQNIYLDYLSNFAKHVFKCIPTRPLYKALVYYHGLSHECFTLCSSIESLKLVTRRWLAMMTKMEKTLLQMYLHSLSCIKNLTEKIVTVFTGCLQVCIKCLSKSL